METVDERQVHMRVLEHGLTSVLGEELVAGEEQMATPRLLPKVSRATGWIEGSIPT